MTIQQLIISENTNITPERYCEAAISYIYNSFGNIKRSKEYWPFNNSTFGILWEPVDNKQSGLFIAKQLIECAINRQNIIDENEDNDSYDSNTLSNSINSINRQLNSINQKVSNINKTSEAIENTSNDTTNEINNIK